MVAIRLHGRGGQGIVTAAELLSVAAFLDGREALAFPSFGSERMGAPVVAYCRIDTRRIRTREPIDAPDVVLVADATLLHHVDVFAGIRPTGHVLVNSTHTVAELGLDDLVGTLPSGHVVSVPATDAARRYLGKPLPNVCLLGALAALTDVVSIGSLENAVHERFAGDVGKANMLAARECYDRLEEYADA